MRYDQTAARALDDWEEIRDSEGFAALVRARRRFVVPALAVFAAYSLAFLLMCGYAPDVIATRIGSGFTVGMAAAVVYLLLAWGLTIAYLRRSDRVWEPLGRAVVAERRTPDAESLQAAGTRS